MAQIPNGDIREGFHRNSSVYTSARSQLRMEPVSKRSLRLVAFLLLALSTVGFVAGCGQKGPLYLPEEGEEKKSKNQSLMGVAPAAL